MKTCIATLVSLIVCGLCFAQTLTVIDKQTREPLQFVSVVSDELDLVAYTDRNGQADISEFAGAAEITLRTIGHESLTFSFGKLQAMSFSVALPRTRVLLEDVVISATRWSQSSRDIPAQIVSISPQETALENPQTAADMLGSSGAIFIQKSQQGGGSPMIRGFSTNRLLYAIDGVRMNTAIFRSGNLQNVISLDPFAIESTEVIFGPGSVIYGSDAIGGVMSLRTLAPSYSENAGVSFQGNATLRYATANSEKTGHVDFSVSGRKWAFLTSISGNDYGDLTMGTIGPDDYLRTFYVIRENDEDIVVDNPEPRTQVPTGYQQYNVMQKVRYKPGANWNLSYGFHHSSTTAYPRYDRLTILEDDLPASGQWDYGPQVWTMHHLHTTHTPLTGWYDKASVRVAFQHFEESRIDRDFQETQRRKRRELVDAWSANLDFNKFFAASSRLYYGLEAVWNDVDSRGTVTDITTGMTATAASRYPQADWKSYAAYVNYQHDVSEQLMLQGGLRLNRYSLDADFSRNTQFFPLPFRTTSLEKTALIGSVGAVLKPDDSWLLHANLSTGFRAPNVDDIGKIFDAEPGSVVVPNPALSAEYAYNAELGVRYAFDREIIFDAAFFYTVLDDAMVRRNFTLEGQDSIFYDGTLSQVQAVQNAARAEVYGFQAGIEIHFSDELKLLSRYNVQIGEEELDDGTTSPSRHAAPAFGLTRLTYSPSEKWQIQCYAEYSAGRPFEDLAVEERGKGYLYAEDDNGNPYAPSWMTFNIKGSYSITEALQVVAGIENLANKRYRPYSSGIAAAGRNAIVSVRVGF